MKYCDPCSVLAIEAVGRAQGAGPLFHEAAGCPAGANHFVITSDGIYKYSKASSL